MLISLGVGLFCCFPFSLLWLDLVVCCYFGCCFLLVFLSCVVYYITCFTSGLFLYFECFDGFVICG